MTEKAAISRQTNQPATTNQQPTNKRNNRQPAATNRPVMTNNSDSQWLATTDKTTN
jgi:hypothetical protein